jgi:hypothetical protein
MSTQDWHPDSEALFRACFGELPPQQAAKVQEHIGACQQCRTEFDEIRNTVAEFTVFYQTEYQSSVPPPPGAWLGFRSALRAEAAKRNRLWQRLRSFASFPRLVPAVGVACALLLAITAVLRLHEVPAASAKEVLDRAEAFQVQRLAHVGQAAVFQKMQVRVGRTTLTRTVYRDIGRRRQVDRWAEQEGAGMPLTAQPAIATELARDFKAERLDWDDPLSAASIRTWFTSRAGGHHVEDSVRRAEGYFTLTSLAAGQSLTEARFVLREADYHPVSARLRFRDRPSEVVLTELAYEVRTFDSLDPTTRAQLSEPHAIEAVPGVAVKPQAAAPDLNELELETWYALHRHDADLGGEAQVQRTTGGIAVKGLVASDERREELRAALRGVPGVRIELQTVAEATAQQSRTLASAVEVQERTPGHTGALQDLLLARFPEQQSRDSFVLATLEAAQHALARGFALERLAARYPARVEAELSSEARGYLRTMIVEHERALRQHCGALFERLDSLAGPSGEEPEAAAPAPAVSWQEVQAQLLRDLQRMDKLVIALVSDSSVEPDGQAALIREYHECSARIRASLRQAAEEGY